MSMVVRVRVGQCRLGLGLVLVLNVVDDDVVCRRCGEGMTMTECRWMLVNVSEG